MKILLAPSETKTPGGDGPPVSRSSFLFPELWLHRKAAVTDYNEFILGRTFEEVRKFFDLKDEKIVESYRKNIFEAATMPAILRYTGVAFDYLDYPSLPEEAQLYVDENVIIFSNLFGPVAAGNPVPDYKYKQGAKLPGIQMEKHYKEYFSDTLDVLLGDFVVDLRAGYYEKFYTVKADCVAMKFLKEGKVVSHWAKAYRGLVLRQIALHRPATKEELRELPIPGLSLEEIQRKKNVETWVFSVEEERPS